MDAPPTNPLDYLLIQNAEAGNLEAVKSCLAQGADINACNSQNENVLMCTLRKSKVNMAIWLIENGVDLAFIDSFGLTAMDYIYLGNVPCPEIFPYLLKHASSEALHIMANNENSYHAFYYAVSNGFVDMVDFFIKHNKDWRFIKNMLNEDVLYTIIDNPKVLKKTDGIYRLLSEVTREERQEIFTWQQSVTSCQFIYNFEELLEDNIKKVFILMNEGSDYLLLVNNLPLPKELTTAIARQWLNVLFPAWYCHRIEKDFMDIEEENKPLMLFSRELKPIKNQKFTGKKANDSTKHSGCLPFGKPKPKFCSIQ